MSASDMDLHVEAGHSGQDALTVAASTDDKPLTDPVCGMKVRPNPEKTVEYAGTAHHFCSVGCVTKFEADPQKYLNLRETDAPPLIVQRRLSVSDLDRVRSEHTGRVMGRLAIFRAVGAVAGQP